MNIEILRDHCLSKIAVTEHFPFDEDTLVFKVAGKMFCLISIKEPDSCNLKCHPEESVQLRENFEAIKPGYHMDKKHWNTVYFQSDASDELILKLVDHSYDMVVAKLSKKLRLELGLA